MLVHTTTVVWLECSFHFLICVLIIIISAIIVPVLLMRNHHTVWAAKLLIFFELTKIYTVFHTQFFVFAYWKVHKITVKPLWLHRNAHEKQPVLSLPYMAMFIVWRPPAVLLTVAIHIVWRLPYALLTAVKHQTLHLCLHNKIPQYASRSGLIALPLHSERGTIQNIYSIIAYFLQKNSNFASKEIW